ncbi:MAG: hypothetical protein GY772_17690, partial [bacterium]|nr:hypothetical protein [bacterium]
GGVWACWFVYVDAFDATLTTLSCALPVRRAHGSAGSRRAASPGEATPVVGKGDDWRVKTSVPKARVPAPAAPRGKGKGKNREPTVPTAARTEQDWFLQWAQADWHGRRGWKVERMQKAIEHGKRILREDKDRWQARNHPRGLFKRELLREEWPTELLLLHYHVLESGRTESLGVGWSEARDRPVFWGKTAGRWVFTLDPSMNHLCEMVKYGPGAAVSDL